MRRWKGTTDKRASGAVDQRQERAWSLAGVGNLYGNMVGKAFQASGTT